MTNNELANALGVNPSVTSRYSLGKNMPSHNRIDEIARITGRVESERVEVENAYKWNGREYEKGLGFQK